MAEEKPIASRRMAGPVGPRSPAVASLTAKEVFGILRRHILLIIFLRGIGLFSTFILYVLASIGMNMRNENDVPEGQLN